VPKIVANSAPFRPMEGEEFGIGFVVSLVSVSS
jgi:hypothetical protein